MYPFVEFSLVPDTKFWSSKNEVALDLFAIKKVMCGFEEKSVSPKTDYNL